jgi:hypothetical protein
MNRRLFYPAVLLALLVSSLVCFSQQKDAEEAKPTVTPHYYKLTFVLKEMDEGKTVNQRSFTLETTASPSRGTNDDRTSVRAGIRLPVGPREKGGMEYVDVGTNIDASRVTETSEGLQMVVSAEISSVAAEPAGRADSTPFRQVRASSSVLAQVGKSTTVFTADDPVSKHRFALEVTPTREQ